MADISGDNRFELIEKYKQKLLDATNIGDSPEEMAVIDNILFRFWQMGWIKGEPSAQQWIPCSERLPEYDAPALLSTAWGKTEIGWWTQRGWVIVPASYRELKQDAVVAWMPLPEPYRGDEK